MKLLLDQNLSPRLVGRLRDLFPGTVHVLDAGLDVAADEALWRYATVGRFVIVSKDEDFSELAVLRRHPPKVIWLQIGSCTTEEVEHLLRSRYDEIRAFEADAQAGVLVIR